MKVATENEPVTQMRIIKLSKTPSLSKKSILTYSISTSPDGELFFKIISNDGGGFWNAEFVSLGSIQKVTQDIPFEKPITSYVLHPLFKGKSVNTPAFLMAVLQAEKLVQPALGREKCFLRCDPNEFMSNINALIQSNINLTVNDGEIASGKESNAAPELVAKKSASKSSKKVPIVAP